MLKYPHQQRIKLYVIFKVVPWHKNVACALLKEPKYYFYDNGLVIGDDGVKLENLIACALLKDIHYKLDVQGDADSLHFVRNKEGKEIDFVIVKNAKPAVLIEVKWNDAALSGSLRGFFKGKEHEASIKRLQVVGTLTTTRSWPNGDRAEPAIDFLATLDVNTLTSH